MIKKLSLSKKKRLLTISIFFILVISIITIASSIFFPQNDIGFSELSLITYNKTTQTFEATRYPYIFEAGKNISIFFMVKNFENIVKYYQMQIKVTKITHYVTYEYPLNYSNSYKLYNNNTYEKILSPATKNEKNEASVFSSDYIWGPINVTLYSNSLVEAFLEGEIYMKIVFELWEFNTSNESFEYSGIFTFLELRYYY